jgi:TolB protein
MSATQMRHQARGLAVLALLGLLAGVGMQATAPPAEATFPGRNGLIFFHSNRVTLDNIRGDFEIFSMRPDGSRLRQVTNNRRVADGQPSVSADGSTVAFVRRLPNSSSAIFVMHADGSGQTRVTHSPFEESAPSISPDGTHIAFVRDDFFKQIFSIAVNGSSETQLTFDAEGSSDNPAWSPDGTQIAFDRDPPEPGHQYYIFTMDADGGHQMRRTAPSQNPEFWEEDPSWSPDGSHTESA